MVFLVLAMPVECSVQHKIQYSQSGKTWLIPPHMIVEGKETGSLFLKLEGHCYGLVNILTSQKLKAAEKPSIAGSKKLTDIVEERNKIAFGQPAQDQLFGDDDDDKAPTEAMEPPKKKRKPKLVLEYPESLEVSLHGECFTVQWPSKKRDDLCVLFTPDHLTKVFDYLFGELEITTGGSKRAYSRTGRYKKDNDKSDQSSLDEAEED